MDRRIVRGAPRMANGTACLGAHLAHRSDARASCPAADDRDGVGDGARASGTRGSMGPPITAHRTRTRRSPDDCREPAGAKTRPPQRTARYVVRRCGSDRRGRVLSSPSCRSEPRADAVRGIPYSRWRPAPPADRLAAHGRGCPRLDSRAGALGDGTIRSRSSGPGLAITAVRTAPGICLLRHTPGCHRRRARRRIRLGAGSARPHARHHPPQRDGRRGNGMADPVDSIAAISRGFVMLPTWVGVVSAISLVIIALAALVAAGGIIAAALGVRAGVKALKGFAGPAIADVRQLIASIKTEADALVGASRDVRQRIVRAVDAAEERLTDLDTLAEVMQQELEETAVDAAATIRDVRRGLSVWRWSRKLLKGKKRR